MNSNGPALPIFKLTCAPYFRDGSAKPVMDIVNFHDRRFDLKFTEQEKTDLVNFLSAS